MYNGITNCWGEKERKKKYLDGKEDNMKVFIFFNDVEILGCQLSQNMFNDIYCVYLFVLRLKRIIYNRKLYSLLYDSIKMNVSMTTKNIWSNLNLTSNDKYQASEHWLRG